MLYRRFGFLQARLLLYKQDELQQLETELDKLDRIHEQFNEFLLMSRTVDDKRCGQRKELLARIEIKFGEYGKCPSPHNMAHILASLWPVQLPWSRRLAILSASIESLLEITVL